MYIYFNDSMIIFITIMRSKCCLKYTVPYTIYIQLIFLSHPPWPYRVDKFELINPEHNVFCRVILFNFHDYVEMLSIN